MRHDKKEWIWESRHKWTGYHTPRVTTFVKMLTEMAEGLEEASVNYDRGEITVSGWRKKTEADFKREEKMRVAEQKRKEQQKQRDAERKALVLLEMEAEEKRRAEQLAQALRKAGYVVEKAPAKKTPAKKAPAKKK